jgi:hypothetical protein
LPQHKLQLGGVDSMAVKIGSKSPRRVASLRLAYSAPEPGVTPVEDVRCYTLPATKSLPFVKLRPHDQPMWRPESYWHVKTTGKRVSDLRLGRRYARAAIAAMKADGNSHLIAYVVHDMMRDATSATNKKGFNARCAVMRGFLVEMSEALAEIR